MHMSVCTAWLSSACERARCRGTLGVLVLALARTPSENREGRGWWDPLLALDVPLLPVGWKAYAGAAGSRWGPEGLSQTSKPGFPALALLTSYVLDLVELSARCACSAAPPTSTHWMPVAAPVGTTKNVSRIAKWPLGGRSPLVVNHASKVRLTHTHPCTCGEDLIGEEMVR